LSNSSSKDKGVTISTLSSVKIHESSQKEKSDLAGSVLSNAALRDKLVHELGSVATYEIMKDGSIVIRRKYFDAAEHVLYRVNIWSSKPLIVINTSDLSQSLRIELEQLRNTDPIRFDKTITEAIESLMTGLNERYYFVSNIAYKVQWRFDP
jgi:hypothetical protein